MLGEAGKRGERAMENGTTMGQIREAAFPEAWVDGCGGGGGVLRRAWGRGGEG